MTNRAVPAEEFDPADPECVDGTTHPAADAAICFAERADDKDDARNVVLGYD